MGATFNAPAPAGAFPPQQFSQQGTPSSNRVSTFGSHPFIRLLLICRCRSPFGLGTVPKLRPVRRALEGCPVKANGDRCRH
jgi:hypothetical protein